MATSPATPLRLLILGAHPDDAEFHAGGLAAIYREGGARRENGLCDRRPGRATSVFRGKELSDIRREESAARARLVAATYEVWNNPDGRLLPTIELREQIIRELRTFAPDLVLTHRLNDYHPDHRAVGQAVQDASYLVTVPPICPDTPILRRDPVVAYLPDLFTRPAPLRSRRWCSKSTSPTECRRSCKMMAQHHSQFLEWIPYNERRVDEVPKTATEQLAWLGKWYAGKIAPRAERNREQLVVQYGPDRGKIAIEFCEVFEISEYAAPLDRAARVRNSSGSLPWNFDSCNLDWKFAHVRTVLPQDRSFTKVRIPMQQKTPTGSVSPRSPRISCTPACSGTICRVAEIPVRLSRRPAGQQQTSQARQAHRVSNRLYDAIPYAQFPLSRALDGIRQSGYRYIAWGTTHKDEGGRIAPVLAPDAAPDRAKELGVARCREGSLGLEPLMLFSMVYPENVDAVPVLTARIKQAQAAGIPQVLTFGHTEGGKADLWLTRFKELGPIARDHGVTIVVKQHGGSNGTGEACAKIVREVNDPGIAVNDDAVQVCHGLFERQSDPRSRKVCRYGAQLLH